MEIFGAMIRQLRDLGGTTATKWEEFGWYLRIIVQLSEVKIDAVLVDLIRTERGRGEDLEYRTRWGCQ